MIAQITYVFDDDENWGVTSLPPVEGMESDLEAMFPEKDIYLNDAESIHIRLVEAGHPLKGTLEEVLHNEEGAAVVAGICYPGWDKEITLTKEGATIHLNNTTATLTYEDGEFLLDGATIPFPVKAILNVYGWKE